MKNKNATEIKKEMAEMKTLLEKIFEDKGKLKQLDIEAKFEGMCMLLRANLLGIYSNSLTLHKLRELVEDKIMEPY